MPTRDEVIRFFAQVQGQKDVEGIGKAFDAVGKAAEAADPAARKLVEDFERIGKDRSAIESFVKLKAQLTETRDKLTQASAGLDSLRNEFGKADGSSKQVTAAFKRAEQAVADLSRAERLQSVELQKTAGALNKAGVDVNKLADADRRLATEGQRVADGMRLFAVAATAAGKGARDAASGVDDLAQKSKEAKEGNDGLLGSLGKIGVLAAALSVAFKGVQLGADAFGGAASIEASLSRVQALATGTAEEFSRLGVAVQDAAREAKVGPELAAQALAELAGQGQNVTQAMQSLVPTLRLAKIASIEVGQAAGAVDDVLDLFGLSADQAGKAVDILVAAAKGSDEGLQGLLGGLSKIAPTARDAGLSFEQTAGMLGVFVQNGFSAEKAAKGLLKIFDDLRDPTSKLRSDLSDLGDNSGTFASAIDTLSDAGDKGKKALDNLDASSRNLVLFLLQQGKGSIDQFTESLQKAEGTASKVAQAIDDNLKGAFANATAAFDNLATAFLAPILAPLKDEIEKVSVAFDEFAKTEAFAKLQGALLTFVQTGLAALGEFFSAIDFDKLGSNLASFGTNASAFFTEFRTDLGEVARFAGNTLNAIGALFDGAAAVIHGAAGTIAGALGGIVKVGALLAEVQIGDKLVSGLTGATSAAEKLNQISQSLFDSANTNFDQTGSSLSSLKTNLDQLLAGLDGTKPAAEGAGAAIAGIGAAAGGIPPVVDEVKIATIELGNAFGFVPQYADDAAASVGRFAEKITQGGGAVQDARNRLQSASEALAALQVAADATPEALARANAEFAAASINLQKLTSGANDGKQAADELAAAYKKLGIVSQADLIDKAQRAADGFDAVVRAQQRGAATAEDVRRAFIAMAEAQLRAAADSDATARGRVENEIRVQAATLGVVDALDKLGLAGKQAGDDVAAGADKAAGALADTASSADQAAASASNLGQSSNTAASGLQNLAQASQEAAGFALEANKAFADASSTMAGLDRTTFNVLEGQRRAFEEELRITREGNAAFDERAQMLNQLRSQYTFLSDAQLQVLANERTQLQQNQQRREEDERRKRSEQQSNRSDSAGSNGGSGGARGSFDLNLKLSGDGASAAALAKDKPALQNLARALFPELKDLIRKGMQL